MIKETGLGFVGKRLSIQSHMLFPKSTRAFGESGAHYLIDDIVLSHGRIEFDIIRLDGSGKGEAIAWSITGFN